MLACLIYAVGEATRDAESTSESKNENLRLKVGSLSPKIKRLILSRGLESKRLEELTLAVTCRLTYSIYFDVI